MCIERNEEDFQQFIMSLAIFYYQLPNHCPLFLELGLMTAFIRSIWRLLTLSTTPDCLQQIGFIDQDQALEAKEDEVGLLMKQALEGVVVVPWALMLDKWRAGIFKGEIAYDDNNSWWDLRNKYQGIAPPSNRSGDSFDPAQKYHIPANTPYTRYYLAKLCSINFMNLFAWQQDLMALFTNAQFMETKMPEIK